MKESQKPFMMFISITVVLSALGFIFHQALQHTQEYHSHNLNGASGNQVFISTDGHKEAVYDRHGNLVTDDANRGSYNYYHPYQQPIRHFFADILSWIILGNTKQDPTTFRERSAAWLKDFWIGMREMVREDMGISE